MFFQWNVTQTQTDICAVNYKTGLSHWCGSNKTLSQICSMATVQIFYFHWFFLDVYWDPDKLYNFALDSLNVEQWFKKFLIAYILFRWCLNFYVNLKKKYFIGWKIRFLTVHTLLKPGKDYKERVINFLFL